jgi:soluble lytic murein transglycosylase-like protein
MSRIVLTLLVLLAGQASALSAQGRLASASRFPTSSEIIARRMAQAAAREKRREAWASRTKGINISAPHAPAVRAPMAEDTVERGDEGEVGAVREDLLGLQRAMGWETRADELAPMIVAEAARYALPPALVLAIIHLESEYRADARSSAGALGLMQVMPFWPRDLGFRFGADLTDRATNLRYGTWVLRNALDDTGGDVRAALLRYNGCRTGSTTPSCFNYPDRIRALVEADARSTCGGRSWGACVVMPIRLSYGVGE